MKSFLYRALGVIQRSYTGTNLLLQVAAVALTYIIVTSGFDWIYFISVRNETLNTFFFPALPIGFFFPIILPALVLASGYLTRNSARFQEGMMLGYAAFLSWFVSSAYKAFTGRVQPDILNTTLDSSRNFHFGFLEHGIFWGWPSSHTAVAFATMTTLILMSPNKRWMRVAAVLYAFYIGIGVSLSIHWFSEFIAGALIGTAVGRSVEEVWREKTSQVLYWKHMKNIIIIISAILVLGGAYAYVAKKKPSLPPSSFTVPASTSSPEVSTIAPPEAAPGTTSVHITKINTVPSGVSSALTYKSTGTSVIAVEVKGSIKNVKLVSVGADGPELIIKKTIKEFGDIENKTLYVITTLPSGLPTEMLTWQNKEGISFSWTVGANTPDGSIDRTYNGIQ